MRKMDLALSIILMLGVGTGADGVFAQGCVLSGVKLDCSLGGSATKPGQITAAFASSVTRENLATPQKEKARFKVPSDRENFRESLEQVWSTVNKYAKTSRRELKRGRIDAQIYEKRAAMYEDALESYRSAYWFYKSLVWQTRDRKP